VTDPAAVPPTRKGPGELTYPEVGATAHPVLPDGYRAVDRSLVIGAGAEVFERAATALLSWQMHRRAGVRVEAETPTAVPGSVVLLRIGLGPLAIQAPCQVVYEITEDRRRGFAYGTLPGHPERGEEAFVVALGSDDRVTFSVRAFSGPATRSARAGGPLTRLAQDLAIRRYLHALRKL
jgi:uncharacterized protein (UPF0548 family)